MSYPISLTKIFFKSGTLIYSILIIVILVGALFISDNSQKENDEILLTQKEKASEIWGVGNLEFTNRKLTVRMSMAGKPSGNINFASNIYKLSVDEKEKLKKFRSVLTPQNNINIYGHTDSQGDLEYNIALSVMRAYSVYQYLEKIGINKNSMQITGVGEVSPIDTNKTHEGMANNRRVEMEISLKSQGDCENISIGSGRHSPEEELDSNGKLTYAEKVALFITKNPWTIILAFISALWSLLAAIIGFVIGLIAKRQKGNNA